MKQITNQQAWDYSLDMIKVDGLTPSNDFLEMVEREKKGEITTDEMRDVVLKKYIPESALTHKCHLCCQYADSIDMPLDQNLLARHSEYLRNALVAANAVFDDDDLGDRSKPEYLYRIILDAMQRGRS